MQDDLKKLIENNALALSTISNDGTIHTIAVAFAKVVSENQILVTDNFMKDTPANIRKNNNVTLAVWNSNWKEECAGYEIKGKAEYFTEGKWKEFVRNIHENKGLSAKGAILIKVEKIKNLVG